MRRMNSARSRTEGEWSARKRCSIFPALRRSGEVTNDGGERDTPHHQPKGHWVLDTTRDQLLPGKSDAQVAMIEDGHFPAQPHRFVDPLPDKAEGHSARPLTSASNARAPDRRLHRSEGDPFEMGIERRGRRACRGEGPMPEDESSDPGRAIRQDAPPHRRERIPYRRPHARYASASSSPVAPAARSRHATTAGSVAGNDRLAHRTAASRTGGAQSFRRHWTEARAEMGGQAAR